MQLNEAIESAHATYQCAYRGFVEEQRLKWSDGSPEVKLRLDDGAGLHRKLFCVDFAAPGEEPELIEMAADTVEPQRCDDGALGGLAITVEALTWGDVEIAWEAPALSEDAFADWFEQWFDPEDLRLDPSALFGGVIHSLVVAPKQLTADLGSAPVGAFWELMKTLDGRGVTAVTVRTSAAAGP